MEPRCKYNAADAVLVGPIEPIGPARVATGRKRVIHATGVTYRHFRSRIEYRAPRHSNDRRGAIAIVDDRACGLDRSAIADRNTCVWYFLGAARLEGIAAKARATVATTKAKRA